MISKCLEVSFEAVPGFILQLYVHLTFPPTSSGNLAVVSMSTSAAATAYPVAVMHFEKDCDPSTRLDNPHFWGVYPDDATARSLAFLWIFCFNLTHISSKGLSITLLWTTFGGRTTYVYYGCEMAMYFLIKIIRQDFFYWAPVHGLMNVFAALLNRVTTKILVDFTGYMMFLHPHEMGGLLWTLTLVWSQLSSVTSAVLYLRFYNDADHPHGDERRDKISATALYSIVGTLVFAWLVSFSSFIRVINRGYMRLFFVTMTAPQYTIFLFRTGKTDYIKVSSVFPVNALFWKPIRGEVMAFTHSNWDRWEAEKPEWFTEQFIATWDDEFIPRLNKDRRRSSVFRGLFLGMGKVAPGAS